MDSRTKRTNSTEFIDVQELDALIERESKRPVASGKENVHFTDHRLAVKWLTFLELPTTAFTENLTLDEFITAVSLLQPQIAKRVLHLPPSNQFKQLISDTIAYLGEADTPQPSDSIFVFGGSNLGRIETAVDLYNQHLAPRIFISGGAPIYKPDQISEAIVFRKWAVDHDVPNDHIFSHDNAISIVDNVRGGLNRLDELGLPYNSMILVITWFAMRRAWSVMMKHVPEGTKLYRVNAVVDPTSDYAPDNWWKNEVGIKTIFNEFAKLKASELLGSS